uniref:Uncharacterized protein n=1 Tax=Lactuca sativa TaxID=4236 RepID=A0A9R1WCG4_LACSA|nr:hypothetical protein LSAT_V11C200090080 [Lactuca sativa]
MAIHEPSVEYWPTSDDKADNEQAQSNFCFVADVLEMEILQLKQDFQESTDKYNVLNEKLTDYLKQINSLETECNSPYFQSLVSDVW